MPYGPMSLFSCLVSVRRRTVHISQRRQFMEMCVCVCIENIVANVSRGANKGTNISLQRTYTQHTHAARSYPFHENIFGTKFGVHKFSVFAIHINATKSAIIPQGNFRRANVVKKLPFVMGFIYSQ